MNIKSKLEKLEKKVKPQESKLCESLQADLDSFICFLKKKGYVGEYSPEKLALHLVDVFILMLKSVLIGIKSDFDIDNELSIAIPNIK